LALRCKPSPWPCAPAPRSPWQAQLTARQFRQTANLAPFDLDGRIAQLGLERTW
jgi:hypothetical protein